MRKRRWRSPIVESCSKTERFHYKRFTETMVIMRNIMRGASSSFLVTVFLLCSSTNLSGAQSNASTSEGRGQCKTCSSCGMPGVPGSNGIPGIPRSPGSPGKDGSRGAKGNSGTVGAIGPKGELGEKGERGTAGMKGEKGDEADLQQRANWKQCVWRAFSNTDDEKIKECPFNKLHSNTALRVSFQGVLQIYSDDRCNRWFFKFNGSECSGPMPIEAILYSDWRAGVPDNYHHNSFEGYCENLPRGKVNVELWVGACFGRTTGVARTGWNSVSRIMIEEVPPS